MIKLLEAACGQVWELKMSGIPVLCGPTHSLIRNKQQILMVKMKKKSPHASADVGKSNILRYTQRHLPTSPQEKLPYLHKIEEDKFSNSACSSLPISHRKEKKKKCREALAKVTCPRHMSAKRLRIICL